MTKHIGGRGGRAAHERIFSLGVLVLILIAPLLMGCIRSPGKYSGVVFYDRWDNCILFNGVYLMYISEAVKETLRPYRGQSVEINATDVHQPVNPGDGLIRRFTFLGPSAEIHGSMPISGIELRAAPSFADQGALALVIEIRNGGQFPLQTNAGGVGFAVLGYKGPHSNQDFLLEPSDGPSYAAITRASATIPTGERKLLVDGNLRTYAWRINPKDQLPSEFTLQAGQTQRTKVTFQLPQGSYQFLAGYGQDVLSGQCVASNAVAFDVDKSGNATVR